jgi:hypothetical protein
LQDSLTSTQIAPRFEWNLRFEEWEDTIVNHADPSKLLITVIYPAADFDLGQQEDIDRLNAARLQVMEL